MQTQPNTATTAPAHSADADFLRRDIHNRAVAKSVAACLKSGNYAGALEAAGKTHGIVERMRAEQRVKAARVAAMSARVDSVVMAAEAVMGDSHV